MFQIILENTNCNLIWIKPTHKEVINFDCIIRNFDSTFEFPQFEFFFNNKLVASIPYYPKKYLYKIVDSAIYFKKL